jgi:hypothetical protein
MCEDAPCCGCCGAAVWAAEDRASADLMFDSYYDDGFGPEYEEDEWEEDE